jgi:hypothetical protein
MVAMTRTGGVPRIALDVGIVGRGHAKIAERGHVPRLSLIVGMFTCTLFIIKGRENRKRLLSRSQRKPTLQFHCFVIFSQVFVSDG